MQIYATERSCIQMALSNSYQSLAHVAFLPATIITVDEPYCRRLKTY